MFIFQVEKPNCMESIKVVGVNLWEIKPVSSQEVAKQDSFNYIS